MNRILFLYISLISPTILNGQIVSNESVEIEEVKKQKEEKIACDTCAYSLFYLNGSVQRSYRSFEDLSVYNTYQKWSDQTPDYNLGIEGGLILPLMDYVQLELGATFFGHGENYNFVDDESDSVFNYNNRYMQIAIPLKLKFVTGDKLRFNVGLGLMPSNILTIRYDESYRFSGGGELIEKDMVKIKNNFSSFNLYALASVGILYMPNLVGLSLGIDYRYGLTNTYANTTRMVNHSMKALVLNYGLVFKF